MHYVIVGCGRVGSALARSLEDGGHSVAIVDIDESAFRRLPAHFEGRLVRGNGFERDTLVAAGIENAYALAAVASGDNTNILAARVARETYDVEHVVARIYDPGRAEVYQKLGIPTVATVRWTAEQVMRRLVPQGATTVFYDTSGLIVIAEVPLNDGWIGHTLEDIEDASEARVAYFTRLGEGRIPVESTVYQEGDIVHFSVEKNMLPSLEAFLSAAPEED